MTNRKTILPWVLVILWMTLIFYLSHQPVVESNNLSTGITEVVADTLEKVKPDIKINLGRLNHIIRKNAHLFAYLILGVLVLNGLRSSGVGGFKAIALALIICVLYAISDEVHQLFVPGRGGQVRDVLIDSIGAVVGIGMYSLLKRYIHI